MKKRAFFFGLVILALMAGCSSGSTPTAVARAYLKAIEKDDLKTLDKVLTPEGIKNMAEADAATRAMIITAYKEYAASLGAIKSTAEEIDGDNAVVTFTFENAEEEVSVKKVNGKWKVTEFD
jgi:hypothetical protein